MSKKQPAVAAPAVSSPLTKFVAMNASHHTKAKFDKIVISARSSNQKEYIKSLQKNDVTLCTGPAGVGKTYLPTLMALDDLVNEKVSKIMIIRPSVEIDGENSIGALPGDILGKYGPQIKPVTDTLQDYLGLSKLTQLMMNEVIEIVPVAFIRGRSPKNTWMLVDEAQNLSVTAMKAILTRPDQGTKLAICGDINQKDRDQNNGLQDIIRRLSNHPIEGFQHVRFTKEDVVRHERVKAILDLYEEEND